MKGLVFMANKKFEEYMRRFESELRNKRFRLDIFSRFVVTWTLMSRFPLPKRWWPKEEVTGAKALTVSPLVGALLGLLTGALISAVNFVGIGRLAAIWTGAAFYAVGGWAIHLDGWSDLWDGIGSGKEGEELRSIMKDSRIGAFGVIGLILAFGLWTSLLTSTEQYAEASALITAGALGRFAICVAAHFGNYPWEKGLAKGWVGCFEGYDIFFAGVCALVVMPFAPFTWFVSITLVSLAAFFAARYMNARLGGVNGDVLGAVAVLGELITLAVYAL
ncbi:MAG: adenosylcobinamide-GDP ribazoletransferase [Synergistaceae bacterium]|nr:adenosylcobinamide-GDP ribazoletransferase [Synergistaceae bacterium]